MTSSVRGVALVNGQASITCRVCGMRSFHPMDVAEGYCGRCRTWTGVMTEQELARAILVLHEQYRPAWTDEYDVCVYCTQRAVERSEGDALAHEPWPCPTVRSLELGEIR